MCQWAGAPPVVIVIRRPETVKRAGVRSTRSASRRRLQPVPVIRSSTARWACMIWYSKPTSSRRTWLQAKQPEPMECHVYLAKCKAGITLSLPKAVLRGLGTCSESVHCCSSAWRRPSLLRSARRRTLEPTEERGNGSGVTRAFAHGAPIPSTACKGTRMIAPTLVYAGGGPIVFLVSALADRRVQMTGRRGIRVECSSTGSPRPGVTDRHREQPPRWGQGAAVPGRRMRNVLSVTLSVATLVSPMTLVGQTDCSISGEQWNDIQLFRRCLAERGLEAWEVSPAGRTVLHNAALQTDNPTIVVLLLEAGSDPNSRDDSGSTPLHFGVQNGNPVVSSHLLAAGSDPNAADNDGYTPLHIAHWNANVRVTELLLEAGANPYAQSNDGWTPFHSAVFSARSSSLSVFLEKGTDFGLAPLHRAIVLGDSETGMSLLVDGAEASAVDDFGWNSLHFAVSMGERRIAIAILEAGGDPNKGTENGLTALHLASDPGMVEALVASGAEIDARSDLGRTPLHQAALYRGARVIEALLDAGADPMAEDNEGNRPADLAERNSRIPEDSDVMRRLRGSDTNGPTWVGLHPCGSIVSADVGHCQHGGRPGWSWRARCGSGGIWIGGAPRA